MTVEGAAKREAPLARMFTGTPGRVFLLLSVMYFIMYVDRTNISVAAPLIKHEFKLSNTQLGLVLSAFGTSYALFQIVNGYLGDRLGPRKMLTILGSLWGVGTLLTGLVGGLGLLSASRMVVGLGEAGTIPTATLAMSRWVPTERRGFAQGFTHSASRLAAGATPMIVVAMIPLMGWRGAFVALGCVSLVWTAVWAWYFRDAPKDHAGVTPADLARLPVIPVTERVRPPWRRLLPRIMPVTLVFFCHAWTLWVFLSWLPTFLTSTYHIDLKSSALYASLIFLAGMVGDTVGGLVTDALYRRTGDLNRARRDVVILGLGGSLVMLSLMLVTHTPMVVSLCLAGALFLLEMAEGPIWSVPMDIAPRYAGTAGGFLATAAGVAAMVSPAVFGWLTDVSGSYKVPFLASIALLVLGVALSFLMRPDKPVDEDEPSPVAEPVAV